MLEVQPKDPRGYFMLPQAPEDAGYYVYGTPAHGAGQYCHPALLCVLLFVEREWRALDHRRFGVGNISKANGAAFPPHGTHKDGLQVDLRPVRKDGKQIGVSWLDHEHYDRLATAQLIGLFRAHPSTRSILFNDHFPGVQPWPGHDDHFHVNIRAANNE